MLLLTAYNFVRRQRDRAQVEARRQAQKAAGIGQQRNTENAVRKDQERTLEEAKHVEQKQQDRPSGERPTGSFTDKRLRDHD